MLKKNTSVTVPMITTLQFKLGRVMSVTTLLLNDSECQMQMKSVVQHEKAFVFFSNFYLCTGNFRLPQGLCTN